MKALSGFPGYFITKQGKIYSERQAGGGGGRKAEMHEVTSTDHGHRYARVVLMKDGKKTTKYVHELMVSTFGGGKSRDKDQVRHLDGNAKNNSASNLKPGTRSENEKDKVRKSLTYYILVE